MKRVRTEWTQEQVSHFKQWHTSRLQELQYPEEVVKELTKERTKWLSKVRVQSEGTKSEGFA